MRRVPVFATLLVALAVTAMIALGVWQLRRLGEKEALLADLAANPRRPAIALPRAYDRRDLFRRASASCMAAARATLEGGHDARGRPGWRVIVPCSGGFAVQLGIAAGPHAAPDWPGGAVTGRLSTAPDHAPLIAALLGRSPPPTPMIVADPPLAGLAANAAPDPSTIPNNHLAYAVQWFVFAALALVIYAAALRRRLKAPAERRMP